VRKSKKKRRRGRGRWVRGVFQGKQRAFRLLDKRQSWLRRIGRQAQCEATHLPWVARYPAWDESGALHNAHGASRCTVLARGRVNLRPYLGASGGMDWHCAWPRRKKNFVRGTCKQVPATHPHLPWPSQGPRGHQRRSRASQSRRARYLPTARRLVAAGFIAHWSLVPWHPNRRRASTDGDSGQKNQHAT